MDSRLIRKILAPTDGSDASLCAAKYAAEIAKCSDAQVVLLNVAEVSAITQFVGYSARGGRHPEIGLREVGESILEKTEQAFLEADVPVRTKIIEGFAPEAIIKEAEDGNYDLIVMGSHGAEGGALRRVLFGLGSVAEGVVSNAPCPVLLVRGGR
jgi:nucleotide-binding universal stress UspA family protein